MLKATIFIKKLFAARIRGGYSLRIVFLCFFFANGLSSCQFLPEKKEETLFQQLGSSETNIDFVNQLQDTEALNILEYLYFYNGAGVAAGDLDKDGYTDLYFVSNQHSNKLYLNKGKQESGSFAFRDVTQETGVEGKSDWQTGVSMVDINGDGWLDIYVCAVGDYKGLKGKNELYISNGLDENGKLSFTEKAAEYGLDFSGFSTQAAFFDYDKDGDLDMFLLNHAVHTSKSYGQASSRNIPDEKAGDYLFENQLISAEHPEKKEGQQKFKDVSRQAGILQAVMGYGLGLVVADMNNDGWDDIYVANDFHEDDYFYVNKGNGTFSEQGKEHFRHFSRFSMGCDAADMNNDGFAELMSLDMYPEDEVVLKSSAGEDSYDIFQYKLKYGYFYQYSRNCLQLNLAGKKFSDVGALAGVAATDWSWSALMADYDHDGWKDIFISNGIVRRPNDLDYIRFVSNAYSRPGQEKSEEVDKKAIDMMPEGKVHNYLFRGNEKLQMEDKSFAWGMEKPSLSNGAVYADLDNDGDLELVTNNINEAAGIYENRSEKLGSNNFLKISLNGQGGNTHGIGARVILKHQGKLQVQQLMPTRGFLSSVEPLLNFGLGQHQQIDSLIVIWPDKQVEIRTKLPVNTELTLHQKDAAKGGEALLQEIFPARQPLFENLSSAYPIDYIHQENKFLDFSREPLIPFKLSTEGPKLAVGDVNGDGAEDFYAGGARGQAGQLFIQGEGATFISSNREVFEADAPQEDTDAVFFDADGDGDLDLYVVSGGNEFNGQKEELLDRLYLNNGKGDFSRSFQNLPPMYANKSCVKPFDYDQDGDLDLFIGGRVEGAKYGLLPDSYLLINDGKGKFSDQTKELAPSLRKAGMLTDAVWADYDGDGDTDLLVVGDWMPIRFFENRGNKLEEVKTIKGLEQSNGFWQAIEAADFDKDGDLDFIAGNLGTNTKLRKKESALKLFIKDIDQNHIPDHILAYQLGEKWYPLATKDELAKQMPFLNKKFYNYKRFAGKTVEEVFGKDGLKGAKSLYVDQFHSIYLENRGNGQFKQHLLPQEAQLSKVFTFYVEDLDGDGWQDVLLGGNLDGVSTYQGRYDASYGLMLKGDGNGGFQALQLQDTGLVLDGELRDIQSVKTSEGKVFLFAFNNLPIQLFKRTAGASNKDEKQLILSLKEGK